MLVDTITKKMTVIMKKGPMIKNDSKQLSSGGEKANLLAMLGMQVEKTKIFMRRRVFDVLEKCARIPWPRPLSRSGHSPGVHQLPKIQQRVTLTSSSSAGSKS